MKPTFTISEVVKTSWGYLKEQIWVLVGLFIGYSILVGILSMFASPTSITASLIVNLIVMVIGIVFMLGYYKNLFQTLDGIEPQFSAYGQQAGKFFTYFVASLIYGIIVMIGTVLLIIPGIYMALRLQFFICFIVEEDAGIVDSLKKSWAITDGQVVPLLILALAMIGICIVGFLLLGIGIFVAAPLIYMMSCYVFRILNTPMAVLEEVVEDVREA